MRIWQVSKGSDINSLLASRTMKSLNQKDATLHATPRDADLPLAPRPGISAAAVNPLFENGVGSMSDAAVDAERKAKAARAKKLVRLLPFSSSSRCPS